MKQLINVNHSVQNLVAEMKVHVCYATFAEPFLEIRASDSSSGRAARFGAINTLVRFVIYARLKHRRLLGRRPRHTTTSTCLNRRSRSWDIRSVA